MFQACLALEVRSASHVEGETFNHEEKSPITPGPRPASGMTGNGFSTIMEEVVPFDENLDQQIGIFRLKTPRG